MRLVLHVLLTCMPLAAQSFSGVQQLEAAARQHLAARDANAALKDYEALAQLQPKSAVYQDEIGFLLAATSRSGEAVPHFERATQLDPNMAQAWYHLGVALLISRQANSGLRDLQKAVALAPNNRRLSLSPWVRVYRGRGIRAGDTRTE